MSINFLTHPATQSNLLINIAVILVLDLLVLRFVINFKWLRKGKRLEGIVLWCEYLGAAIIGASAIPNPFMQLGGLSPLVQRFDPFWGVQLVNIALYKMDLINGTQNKPS